MRSIDIEAGVIGKPKREVTVEPQEEPVPQTLPAPESEPAQAPQPLTPA
jgi:hypothetical protein